jgi:hypothetical protein
VVVIVVALPAVIHVPVLLAVVVAAGIYAFAGPTILARAGGGGQAAIIRAETAARAQQAKDNREKILLWAQLISGAIVLAWGLLDIYVLRGLPLAVDLALLAGGALALGVKIVWPK